MTTSPEQRLAEAKTAFWSHPWDQRRNALWKTFGTCAPENRGDLDPDIFYNPQGDDLAEAKQVCGDCPVQLECAAFGLVEDIEPHDLGVYGGLTIEERRLVVSRNPNLSLSPETLRTVAEAAIAEFQTA